MRMNFDYIAGFFDGEGSVSTMCFTHRTGLQATIVTLSQSGTEGLRILTAIRDFLGVEGIKGYIHTQARRANYRVMHHLKISARDSVVRFLEAMLPRSSVKFVVTQDTLRFHKLYPSLRGPITAERNRERGKYGALLLDADSLRADLAAGMSRSKLAAKYKTSTYTIKKYLDPDYRKKYDEYRRNWRARRVAAARLAASA